MSKKYMSLLTWLVVLLPLPSVVGATSSRWEKATFAGGCFWCMESPFEGVDGIKDVVSGYSGGSEQDANYNRVCSGATEHLEAIQVTFDANKVDYATLLNIFWRQIDPTDDGGQFVDRGPQYRSAIFYHSAEQRLVAEASKKQLAESGRYNAPLVTSVLPFVSFYAAEDYHQDYHTKSSQRYCSYRSHSGRDAFLNSIWGAEQKTEIAQKYVEQGIFDRSKFIKPTDEQLRNSLTKIQYDVTQHEATEAPFKNSYNDNKQAGIYVDIVSGEPLFSSRDKFDSGTGWPSFSRPLSDKYIVEKKDRRLFYVRTEVRSRLADSHLGHVFNDGPAPTGQRYCMNSAALRFVPLDEMAATGYSDWLDAVE
jgi:peptide methionine sulfoxide reductase msrA/msrB